MKLQFIHPQKYWTNKFQLLSSPISQFSWKLRNHQLYFRFYRDYVRECLRRCFCNIQRDYVTPFDGIRVRLPLSKLSIESSAPTVLEVLSQ